MTETTLCLLGTLEKSQLFYLSYYSLWAVSRSRLNRWLNMCLAQKMHRRQLDRTVKRLESAIHSIVRDKLRLILKGVS